ncbi:MAG: Uncharacterised protein [Flavobacteriaceae bacterium]|nr:MAG: Uncharacterised protein [Flavobacteriaceae bacterium]
MESVMNVVVKSLLNGIMSQRNALNVKMGL